MITDLYYFILSFLTAKIRFSLVSFNTICVCGGNASIIHLRVTTRGLNNIDKLYCKGCGLEVKDPDSIIEITTKSKWVPILPKMSKPISCLLGLHKRKQFVPALYPDLAGLGEQCISCQKCGHDKDIEIEYRKQLGLLRGIKDPLYRMDRAHWQMAKKYPLRKLRAIASSIELLRNYWLEGDA